jgi:hypothetical protein
MEERQFYNFYRWVIVLAFMPYMNYAFPFIPQSIGPFNLSGYAWIIMLIVVMYYLQNKKKSAFPYLFWIPLYAYIFLYLLIDYSFPGLQLTLQYTVPFLVGVQASYFTYTKEKLSWLYGQLLILSGIIVLMFAFGELFRHGWVPMEAQTPMLLSVTGAVTMGVFYQTRKILFLLVFICLFLVPFIAVTRMGIFVFLIIFIFHFANRGFVGKIMVAVIGLAMVMFVFNSKGFQEKTFYSGSGEVSDLSLNYYESGDQMNTSGRSSFMQYYEDGIKKSPVFGNGPRADIYVLKDVWGGDHVSEAHNDYIAVKYNYGNIGLGLLLLGLIATFIDVYRMFSKETNPYKQLLQSTVMTMTLTFMVYMYSDNILKSTVLFTDLYFALIGMVYAKYESSD